jgi:hypothetical protein
MMNRQVRQERQEKESKIEDGEAGGEMVRLAIFHSPS